MKPVDISQHILPTSPDGRTPLTEDEQGDIVIVTINLKFCINQKRLAENLEYSHLFFFRAEETVAVVFIHLRRKAAV